MKYNKQEALKIVVEAAKHYEEKLNDYHFKITYLKDGKQTAAYIGFRETISCT